MGGGAWGVCMCLLLSSPHGGEAGSLDLECTGRETLLIKLLSFASVRIIKMVVLGSDFLPIQPGLLSLGSMA